MRLWLCSSLLVAGAVAGLLSIGESSVITGVLFLMAVALAAGTGARAILRGPAAAPRRLQVNLTIGSAAVMLLLLEMMLRYGLGTHATYPERNGSRNYRSIYAYDNPTWFHLYRPHESVWWVRREFTHARRVNSLGLADDEYSLAKRPDEYRVIALGDSFTEGVGASHDESWVKAFERHVPRSPDGRVVHALNAGVSGSDLLFELVLLRERLRPYQPDLVIVAVNNSDISDLITRGGEERFRSDGTVRGRRGPSWDWVYGLSYITRHVVHDLLGYSWLLLRPGPREAAETEAAETLRATLTKMSRLCDALGARFVTVFHPHEYEVAASAYIPPAFGRLAREVTAAPGSTAMDLLDVYARDGRLTAANAREFYWPLDIHHNARGYALMGEMVASEVARRDLLRAGPE